MIKLSEQLHDAMLLDKPEEVERIKKEIEHRKIARNDGITPTKINTVLNDEKASAIKIYDFLNKALEPDWWEWEFETIERILWVKYGVALEDNNRDKIFAIRHLCRSDGAFADWYEFNQMSLSFAGAIADFEYLRSPSPGMVVNAVHAMDYIRPDRKGVYSNDVIKYMCIVFINDGVYTPPPSLVYLVKEEMKKMVSSSTSDHWLSIFKQYNKFNNDNYKTIDENLIDIQAKRLLKVESAASSYTA